MGRAEIPLSCGNELPAWVQSGALGNIVGALANAVLMFRLKGGILVVISPPSALSGAIGGFLAFAAGRYLLKVSGKEALRSQVRAKPHTPGEAR